MFSVATKTVFVLLTRVYQTSSILYVVGGPGGRLAGAKYGAVG